ncbi:MAG: hypothetical protein EA385_05760 [Salinarimonadaceae bacterium]|nr:MAG: hypothetical protein EA385_05760 [Salinarimonadaceae bacterium]
MTQARRARASMATTFACALLPALLPALLATLASAFVSIPAAHAQVVDFSRVNCAQLNRLPAAQKRQIALWLHGYYTGATQRPFLDMAGAEEGIRALVETCGEEPETALLGEEARAILSGAAEAKTPRAVERSPGHIVIEQSASPDDSGAATRAPNPGTERPRPID